MCRDVRESDRDRAFKVCILDPVLVERGEKEAARGVMREAWGETRGTS